MQLLNNREQYDNLVAGRQDFIIFKHSGSCSISGGACKEVEIAIVELGLENIYLLDVLHTGDLKYQVADACSVKHESPQVLIFEQGKLINHANHGNITREWLREKCKMQD